MRITKTDVGTPTRRLGDGWVMEQAQELEHAIGDELRREIDNEIMNTVVGQHLVGQGWHQVMVEDPRQIGDDWIAEHMSGGCRYTCFGHYWYFERAEDAVLFRLSWA